MNFLNKGCDCRSCAMLRLLEPCHVQEIDQDRGFSYPIDRVISTYRGL